jgi:DNA-binding NtrC family response regulator
MVVLARSSRLTVDDLPPQIRSGPEAASGAAEGFDLPAGGVRLVELERHLIEQALRRSRDRLGPAAQLLGISYKTLQYRVRKHGLERELDPGTGPAAPSSPADG